MATKKQKREAGAAKRAEFLNAEKQLGLEAQKWDRDRRNTESLKVKAEVLRIKNRLNNILEAYNLRD